MRSAFISIALTVLLHGMCESKTDIIPNEESGDISSKQEQTPRFVTVKDGKFIDPEGRELILHGVNISEKSKKLNYLSWHAPEAFAKMREWGFNCIRLVILWDGVEPEPGRYDDAYLAGIDKRIQWAKENGMYVLLDMHQDLFSAKFGGDGAPDWATLDDGKPHIHNGPVWSTAYFTSPAVQAAFDNFWANKFRSQVTENPRCKASGPAPDSVGLQDHFARAWRHVARRYADEPAVVGYDLFNEPFQGSTVLQSVPQKLKALAEGIAAKHGGDAPDIAEIVQKSMEPNGLLGYLNDFDVYKAFVDGGASPSMEFERTILSSFYNRVAEAIRQVDRNHILFMEPNILCNAGTPSGITPIRDFNRRSFGGVRFGGDVRGFNPRTNTPEQHPEQHPTDSDGNRDPLQAFAPHGYDLVTDTEEIANASAERIEFIYGRHAETAKRLSLPVLVGEWGAFGGKPDTLPAAQMVVRQIEKHLFSDTYWSYSSRQEIDDAPYFSVLARPYPAAVAGTLLRVQSHPANRRFSCAWKEDPAIAAPSRIYLPAHWFPDGYRVDLEPIADGWRFEQITAGSSNGYLVIPPTGQEVERKLAVQFP